MQEQVGYVDFSLYTDMHQCEQCGTESITHNMWSLYGIRKCGLCTTLDSDLSKLPIAYSNHAFPSACIHLAETDYCGVGPVRSCRDCKALLCQKCYDSTDRSVLTINICPAEEYFFSRLGQSMGIYKEDFCNGHYIERVMRICKFYNYSTMLKKNRTHGEVLEAVNPTVFSTLF